MNISFDDSVIKIDVDKEIYSLTVLHKCFYWYTGKYSLDICALDSTYLITISDVTTAEEKDALIQKIRKDLIDFKTREIISIETKNIRDLLIAKAFAHEDTFEEDPPPGISDPLGFDPTSIK